MISWDTALNKSLKLLGSRLDKSPSDPTNIVPKLLQTFKLAKLLFVIFNLEF